MVTLPALEIDAQRKAGSMGVTKVTGVSLEKCAGFEYRAGETWVG